MALRSLNRWFVPLLLMLAVVASAAGAANPVPQPVTPGPGAVSAGLSGTYSWDSDTIKYESRRTGSTTVDSKIWGANGQLVATAHLDLNGAEVTVAGVTIRMDDEVSDEQAAVIDSFSRTKDAAAIRAMASALAGMVSQQEKPEYLGLAALALTLGEGEGMPQFEAAAQGNCFGCCGPGCWGCHLLGNCYTDACKKHDACVAKHGHLKCLGGLLSAIWSYFVECILAIFF